MRTMAARHRGKRKNQSAQTPETHKNRRHRHTILRLLTPSPDIQSTLPLRRADLKEQKKKKIVEHHQLRKATR